jgi:serine kinase of HPr protein (carbohydrate metabolism regulator)
MIRHASLVAIRLDGRWSGALIEGPSGAGKSDLALRAMAAGFRLVSDDGTVVWASGGVLYGRSTDPLVGLIEARGVGILTEPPVWIAAIRLVVACALEVREVERLPEPRTEIIAGIEVVRLELHALEASAPAKMRRAIEHLGRGGQQAYLAPSLGGQNRAGTGDTA